MPEQLSSDAPPRPLVIVAVLLGVALAVVAAVAGLSRSDDGPAAPGPLALVPVEAPESDSRACGTLLDAMPERLPSAGSTLDRRVLAEPAPPATAGWGAPDPVILRCGLSRPPELKQDSQLQVINGVQWLRVAGAGSATWFTVDRDVYVALTVPDAAGTGPLQSISDTISATLRPVPPRP